MHPPRGVLRDDLLGRTTSKDAACQAPQSFGNRRVIGTPAAVDDADRRVALDRVPDALGELEVSEGGPVNASLASVTQIHVRE
ncbi:MAG: hypothetical protein V3R24_00685 [Gemmatimonadales bacterium]